jgi:multiple sugar transport system permease protein
MRYSSLEEIRPPYKDVDLLEFYRGKGSIRMAFLWRNGIGAIRLAVLQGRALLNTAILCLLSVAGALIVNPLAAYALSRFRRVLSHRVHFLLLVTAAFPAILTMVPNFFLLRGLGLLNTYWAVVFPTMASGLGILLLKSYFDRIPPELYETARLDGAGEFRTFTHVCLPLSRPILAIVALQTFVFSYGRFLWPLLTCQKEKMWPLMVWLYQLELRHGADSPQLVMAALLIAALPLVTVYILCQRAMSRGISLPSFR